MAPLDEILAEVLKEITPTQKEIVLISNITNKLKNLLSKRAAELNIFYTKIEPQGSTGVKQTQLKNDFDIDLFVGLDYTQFKLTYEGLNKSKTKKESKKDFLALCNNWVLPSLTALEFYNPRLLYAEHPYVTVEYLLDELKVKIDIVLYFDLDLEYIKNHGPITAVDRSPWHGSFVKEELDATQKNHVRLLKQFFKSCYSYGDKSPVGKVGFIGYSAELLIYYFNDLLNLFKNFNELDRTPLDYYNRNEKELEKIIHFQNDYLIIIDPIDKNRNVASAISQRAYKYCNQKISEFLKQPSPEFFKIKPIPEINLSDKDDSLLSKIYIIELINTNSNIHYTINRDKLYSLGESIRANGEKEFSHTDRFGQIIFEVYFEDENNQYNVAIYCEKPKISKTYTRKGPPIKEEKHVFNFKRKNPEYFEKQGYLWIETPREFISFSDFLNEFLENKLPDNFYVVNASKAFKSISTSAKRAIYILKNIVLPFYVQNSISFRD
jgi:tRNA nucleotidyltransferase (CCA-adding enzyme)